MSKRFLTYHQQIEKLQVEKGLTVSDPLYAEEVLQDIGYSALIGGYKYPFKHGASGKYIHGVDFKEIVILYQFDASLRMLFLEYILQIEQKIKSLYSYSFCSRYGESQSAYLNPDNYNQQRRTSKDITRLIHTLHAAISLPTHFSFIAHNINKYGNVPLWVAMNALTFGQVSKMYQYAKTDLRSDISRCFSHVSEKELHTMIRILAKCRNICAHGDRLYSFHTNESISNMPLHRKLNIPMHRGHYVCGTNDLFAVIIALRYLLDNNDFKLFKQRLTRLIKRTLALCPHIGPERLYSYMGFPENWAKITRYKL